MVVWLIVMWLVLLTPAALAGELEVGFGDVDITPELRDDQPVWLAGYYPGRRATAVHDPLFARCVVLRAEGMKLAWVSVDLIGLQYPAVQQIRRRLADFAYVLVASTHNHEGPDVIGIWGETFLHRGVDDAYVDCVIERVVEVVRRAERGLRPARAEYGVAADESLLADLRQPIVKDGVLRVLRFCDPESGQVSGLVVQWNCHPEALGAENTQLTADFPAATVAALSGPHGIPVVYFSGALGGLLAPPDDRITDDEGRPLMTGSFAFAQRYGEAVAQLAREALARAAPIELTPFRVAATRCGVPIANDLYRWARLLGVLRREAYAWNAAERTLGAPLRAVQPGVTSAIETEVACLRLGELLVAALPGEVYPELVYGHPANLPPEVDYPDAPLEPTVTALVPGRKWLLFGLANDEIGYFVPRRQWDVRPPYAYHAAAPQYGEINSCGPETAAVILDALSDCVARVTGAGNEP